MNIPTSIVRPAPKGPTKVTGAGPLRTLPPHSMLNTRGVLAEIHALLDPDAPEEDR